MPALAQDVAGWGKTTWGMSQEKVKSPYADRIAEVRDNGEINLKTTNMGGIPVVIRLVFDQDGKLYKVILNGSLSERKDNRVYIERFKTLRTLLVQKYGLPDKEQDNTAENGYVEMGNTWYRGKTRITLTALEELLVIAYLPLIELDDL
jgi:hypothetical protein